MYQESRKGTHFLYSSLGFPAFRQSGQRDHPAVLAGRGPARRRAGGHAGRPGEAGGRAQGQGRRRLLGTLRGRAGHGGRKVSVILFLIWYANYIVHCFLVLKCIHCVYIHVHQVQRYRERAQFQKNQKNIFSKLFE